MNYEFQSEGAVAIDLDGCLVQVEASKSWFTRRVLPLSIEQLRWRPDPRRWSIAECLDHLNATLALYLPKIDAAVGLGRREGRVSPGGFRYVRSELEALRSAEPPVTHRIDAPPVTLPAAAVDPDWLVEQFHQMRDRYADSVRRAFGLDLPHILIVEPIFPLVRSLGASLAFMAAHDRRHMWQAERVRRTPGFPHAVFTSGPWPRPAADSERQIAEEEKVEIELRSTL